MLERFGLGRVLSGLPRLARHLYAILVVMVGWVFFRSESLGMRSRTSGDWSNPQTVQVSDAVLGIALNVQTLTALLAGSVLAMPVLPWVLERLHAPRAEVSPAGLPDRLATRNVHSVAVGLLLLGFVVCVAGLVGSTLNPFLYFGSDDDRVSSSLAMLIVGVVGLVVAAFALPAVLPAPGIEENRVLAQTAGVA